MVVIIVKCINVSNQHVHLNIHDATCQLYLSKNVKCFLKMNSHHFAHILTILLYILTVKSRIASQAAVHGANHVPGHVSSTLLSQ